MTERSFEHITSSEFWESSIGWAASDIASACFVALFQQKFSKVLSQRS